MCSRADETVMVKGNAAMDLELETKSYPAISLTFVVLNTPEGVFPE
jgi:hypothetical protein